MKVIFLCEDLNCKRFTLDVYPVWLVTERPIGCLCFKQSERQTDIVWSNQHVHILFRYSLMILVNIERYTQSDKPAMPLEDNKEQHVKSCGHHEVGHPFIWYEANWLKSFHFSLDAASHLPNHP